MHLGDMKSLVRNDFAQKEIQDVLTEAFGDQIMGFKLSEDLTIDPFASDNDSNSISEEDESNQTSDHHAEISFTLYLFFFVVQEKKCFTP